MFWIDAPPISTSLANSDALDVRHFEIVRLDEGYSVRYGYLSFMEGLAVTMASDTLRPLYAIIHNSMVCYWYR